MILFLIHLFQYELQTNVSLIVLYYQSSGHEQIELKLRNEAEHLKMPKSKPYL